MKALHLSFYCFLTLSLLGAHSCGKGDTQIAHAQEIHNKLNDTHQCATNNDCTLLKTSCCGCNEGGKQRAVPTAHVEAELDKLIINCQESMCIQVLSSDPSCKQKAQCSKGRCILE